MTIESWFPIDFELPDGARCGRILHCDSQWQIVETKGGGTALITVETLFCKWVNSGLLVEGEFKMFEFGAETFVEISCGPSQTISPLSKCKSPRNRNEALAFAIAMRATRAIDSHTPLDDSVYIEKLSRLLPCYGIDSKSDDTVVLGHWLTGGANVSVRSFRRLSHMLSWLSPKHLQEIIEAAGIQISEESAAETTEAKDKCDSDTTTATARKSSYNITGAFSADGRPTPFALPGRRELEAFFNEHVVDVLHNKDRYATFGLEFPSAIILHGPPGCGKTFAVAELVDYLGWPSFQIDASSVASPYIHETSKKIAEVFDKAIQHAPSVLIIDEMEAFLADRDSGSSSHYRLEEVSEFLRRIPEAGKNEVLIIAMTNRIDMIDQAIMRRGRFDHVIKVDFASADEVLALLKKLLSKLPTDASIDPVPIANSLVGRPLSDVAFVVREGARLAARCGATAVNQQFLLLALDAAPSRTRDRASTKIGFV